MTDQSNGFALKRLLESLTKDMQSLQQLLDNEKQILIENDSEKLVAISQEKKLLLDKIHHTQQSQQQVLPEEFEKFITRFEPQLQTELKDVWQRFHSITQQCKRQNEVNGTVMAVSKHNINRVLNLFRGVNESNQTYDSTGRTTA